MKKIILPILLLLFAIIIIPQKSYASQPANNFLLNFNLPTGAQVHTVTDLDQTNHVLKIWFLNPIFADRISYELTYKHGGTSEGVTGSFNPRTVFPILKTIVLGTCSTGGACTYHTNLSEMKLNTIIHYVLFDKTASSSYTILP